jgi:hypothetical protein
MENFQLAILISAFSIVTFGIVGPTTKGPLIVIIIIIIIIRMPPSVIRLLENDLKKL